MTTREGGVSMPPYAGFNLGDHVGDNPEHVARNRAVLAASAEVDPLWLRQVHGIQVVFAEDAPQGVVADACVSRSVGRACAIMTADCLPVIFCDRSGGVVAAAHAGWRGLCDGVLEATVSAMGVPPGNVMAWLGAAIGPEAFEVGDEVRAAFVARDSTLVDAFTEGATPGKWMGDLYTIARRRLAHLGIGSVHGGGLCTHGDAKRFFSYRRDGVTGRMVAMVWLTAASGASAY